MRFTFLSLLMVASFFSVCRPVFSAGRSVGELWVTFDVAGERYRAQVRDQDREATAYVRSFVLGLAPSRVPEKFARSWLAAVKLDARPEGVHVARVEECRDAVCIPLRGLYAGRSPAF